MANWDFFKSTIFCFLKKRKKTERNKSYINNQNQETFIDIIINYKFCRTTDPFLVFFLSFFFFFFFFAVLPADQKINLFSPKYDLINNIFDLRSHYKTTAAFLVNTLFYITTSLI